MCVGNSIARRESIASILLKIIDKFMLQEKVSVLCSPFKILFDP